MKDRTADIGEHAHQEMMDTSGDVLILECPSSNSRRLPNANLADNRLTKVEM